MTRYPQGSGGRLFLSLWIQKVGFLLALARDVPPALDPGKFIARFWVWERGESWISTRPTPWPSSLGWTRNIHASTHPSQEERGNVLTSRHLQHGLCPYLLREFLASGYDLRHTRGVSEGPARDTKWRDGQTPSFCTVYIELVTLLRERTPYASNFARTDKLWFRQGAHLVDLDPR